MVWNFLVFSILLVSSYLAGKHKALRFVRTNYRLHSQANYHGYYLAICAALPALSVLIFWIILEPIILKGVIIESLPSKISAVSAQELNVVITEVKNISKGLVNPQFADISLQVAANNFKNYSKNSFWIFSFTFFACCLLGIFSGYTRIHPDLTARHFVEKATKVFLIISSLIAILTTAGIIFSLVIESIRFFNLVPLSEFLFGTKWNPQIAIRSDQIASSGAFGAIPLFSGTLLIALIAMCVATPIGLFTAIYLVEYADRRIRAAAKPMLEILAGVPTVVYGFFAALTVGPFFRDIGTLLGLSVSSESALAAGVVMGVMIIPFISSLSDDVIHAVPQTLRDGSYALGATKSETIKKVVIPAALPGIVGAILLALSRAIGETMIVVMAAGLTANLTANPLSNVTTVTVQIVTILVGDQEFDSAKTLAAFALGLMLFVVTLFLNVIALKIVNKYREKYD